MPAPAAEALTAEVADTLPDGRGVISGSGKTVFLHGAIGGENVRYRIRKRRRHHDDGELLEVLSAAPSRVAPRCKVFGTCGGCALQHIEAGEQLRLKEKVLMENLARLAGLEPARRLPALSGPAWGYRRKARLGVKYVAKKGRVLVGFRERHAPYVTDTSACETLHPGVGQRLPELAALIGSLSIRDRIPQIEVAIADNGVALVFRVLDPPSDKDLELLRRFVAAQGLFLYLQSGGPDTVTPLPGAPQPPALCYRLAEEDLGFEFGVTDFVQVNAQVNEQMVHQAMELLQPGPDSAVLDLFCGLGNFSLPLARRAGQVVGLEGSPAMVARAAANAAANHLANASFQVADLADSASLDAFGAGEFDRVLLDPPRAGAEAILAGIARLAPERLVYVSCHPGTLSRDLKALCHELGYRLDAAGVIDMFPQTAHVEAMALLLRD